MMALKLISSSSAGFGETCSRCRFTILKDQLVGELECVDRGGSKVQLERGVARRELGAVVLDGSSNCAIASSSGVRSSLMTGCAFARGAVSETPG